MIKKLITNRNFFFLVFFFISSQIPFLEFLEKNISDLDFIFGKSLFFLNFLILVLLISFSYLVYIVSKKKISLKHCFLIALTFYILFFQHNSLKFSVLDFFNFFGYENFYYNAEISFVILLLISSIISYFLIRDNFFIKRFVYILFILIFSLNLTKFTISFINLEKKSTKSQQVTIFKDKLNEKKENIYFFILDSMLPIDHFEGFYTSDQKDFLKYIDTMNYEYTYGTKNFYNTTTHNLSAIFHLDRIFDKNNQLKYKGLYPMMLKEGFFSPKLILNLEKWGYQFKWVGNTFAYCSIINIKYCLEKKNTFINPDLFVTFLKASPAVHIAIILGGFNYDKNFLYRDNNGIYKLKENLEKNKTLISSNRPTFYFVHHFSPHWPYITDRDCNYTEAYPDTINLEGYKEAYLCNLKRIKEMINFLNINDPNSFVVFQSDHSWEMSKLSEQKYGNRNEIFNLVKLDKDCKLDKNENLNNVNIMLLIISCITGNEISKID